MNIEQAYKKGFDIFTELANMTEKPSNREIVYSLYKEYPNVFCDVVGKYLNVKSEPAFNPSPSVIDVPYVSVTAPLKPERKIRKQNGNVLYYVKEEINFLVDNFKTMTLAELTNACNTKFHGSKSARSASAIKQKLIGLGVASSSYFKEPSVVKEIKSTPIPKKSYVCVRYSGEEVKHMKHLKYMGYTAKEIANSLTRVFKIKRTPGAVAYKLKSLGF